MDFESPPPPPPPREPGRARQRIQQRRQDRTQTTAREPRRRGTATQLAPSGVRKLPKFNITRSQLLPFSIVGAVLFIVVAILLPIFEMNTLIR